MAAIDFTGLLLSVLLCFVAGLTSSVNVTAGTDGTSSVSPLLSQALPPKPSLPSSTVEHSVGAVNDTRTSKNLASTLVMAEGGPISISTSTQYVNMETVTESNISDESRVRENVPKEKNAVSSIVARKGVEEKKVKPRKGVDNTSLEPEQVTVSFNQTTLENTKSAIDVSETAQANNQSATSNVNTSKLNSINSHSNDSLDHDTNSNASLVAANITTSHTEASNNTTTSKPSSYVEKHIPKPKPTVTTIGRAEINESRPPLRTKNPSLGMSRKIDYIVPVIITIIALPILGTAIFILYRRGRDCWDKRHYRRMDFLIDGMYND